jgi:hypothetical protein
MGQWKYPGQVTRIPSDNITMQGVNYPVWAQPNVGPGMMMQPGQDYMFPEADYVDEYPQMQKGGASIPTVEDAGSMNEDGIWVPDWEAIARQAQKLNAKTVKTVSGTIVSFDNNWQVKNVDDNPQMKRGGSKKNKKYTRNITATNKLFAENSLFKKPGKKQIYDPLAELYQDGGEPINYLEAELTDEEIQAYRDGGYVVEDISVPQLTKAQKGIVISDPKEYAYRKQMYDDSLNLNKAFQMQDKLMGPGSYKTKDKYKWNTAELKEGRRKEIVKGLEDLGPMAKDYQSEADQFKNGYNEWTARKQDKKLLNYYKKLGFKPNQIMYHSSPDIVSDKIKAVGSYFDGDAVSPIYKKPVQPVYFKDDVLNEYVKNGNYDESTNPNGWVSSSKDVYLYEKSRSIINKVPTVNPMGKRKIGETSNATIDPATGNVTEVITPNYENLLPLKKLETERRNQIIESKVQQRKQSDYKTAYRDQTIVSYDPTIKQFIQTGSRKAPLPYSEKIGTKDWELNTSQEIPESGPLVWQVNGKDYYNQEEAKKAQAFMPQGSYNFETGGEADDYMDLELTDDEIQQYARGGYIIEELPEAQEGKETGVESYTPWQNAPEEYAPYVTNMEELPVVAEAAPWAKLSNEYEKKNSKQAFIESKKRDYLKKTNKGLSKMAGLSLDNFPKDVASNFADEYEYKKNNYVTKKLGNKKGFNPRRRDEWVDELTPGERNVVANSKYGSKLQPGYWNRALAGVQELGNTVLPGQPLQYNIPGLTKKEQKEMRDSKLSALEMFAPMDIPGAIIANYLKNNGISTGSNFKNQPAFYSGEKMSNVTDADAMALNPLNYAGLEAIPELGMNLVKGAKALPGTIKASKESGLLSNAYKINPYSFQKNLPKDVMFRGIGEEGLEDVLKSNMLKSPDPLNPDIYWTNRFNTADNYADPVIFKNTGKIDIDGFPQVTSKKSKKIIATYPKSEPVFSDRYTGDFENMNTVIQKSNYLPTDKAKFYKEHWLHGYKEVPKELPGSPNNEELVDLWRIQERDAKPMAQLAAEGKLGKHFQNEKAINHFKDREEHFGKWFTKDKNDFDFYKADREFNDPEIINLKVPRSKLEQYNQYNKSLSRAPDREFVVPFEEQELYKKEDGGLTNEVIEADLTPEEIEWYKSQGYIVEELD